MKPVYPTIPTAHTIQHFNEINWSLYGKTNGRHMGIDIGVSGGQPGANIYSVYDGEVLEAGYYETGGYGRRVVIDHGEYKTLYAHLKFVNVKAGDIVVTGQKLGEMGGNLDDKFRGASLGTHLHFEVILPSPVPDSIMTSRGWTVDPFQYLMKKYYSTPINRGLCISSTGMKVRTKATVGKDSIQIGVVNFKDYVDIMELTVRVGGQQWCRLWSLREEWVAVLYNGIPYIDLQAPVIEAVSEAPVSSMDWEVEYNKAIDQAVSILQGMKK